MSPTSDDESGSQGITKKRRSMQKCDGCRHKKIACLPKDRVWAGNVREPCNNCSKNDLLCGPNIRHNAILDTGPRRLVSKDAIERQTVIGSAPPAINSRPDIDITSLAASNAFREESLLNHAAPEYYGLPQAASWVHSGVDQEMTIGLSTPGTNYRPPSVIDGDDDHSQFTYEPMPHPWLPGGEPSSVSQTTTQYSAGTTTVPYASSVQGRSTRVGGFANPPAAPVPAELRFQNDLASLGNEYLPDTAFRLPSIASLEPSLSSPDQPFHLTEEVDEVLEDPSLICSLVPLSDGCSFRLVELYAGHGDALLEARLIEYNPEKQSIHYEALSYTWGGESYKPTRVLINTNDGAMYIRIGENLADALRAMRYIDGRRMLWIDALCINSRDVGERNSQMSMTREIYQQAAGVCVWLGLEAEDSDLAFQLILQSTKLDAFARLVQDPSMLPYRASLTHLLMRPWFRRMETVQEVALAKETILYCGRLQIGWRHFENAVTLFGSMYDDFKSVFRSKTDRLLEVIHDLSLFDAIRIVQTSHLLVRKSDSGEVLQYLQPLESLVSMCTNFEARDPRDKIYALLAISRDANPAARHGRAAAERLPNLKYSTSNMENRDAEPRNRTERQLGSLDVRVALELPNPAVDIIRIDYRKSVYDVCREFLDFAVGRSKSLDILCRPWAPKGQILPSWMPTVDGAAHILGQDKYYRRVRADPLVERYPTQSFAMYNAARGTSPVWHCEGATESFGKLYVRGFALGSICARRTPATAGIIPHVWFKFAEWGGITPHPAHSFWKVLVADRAHASPCAVGLSYEWAYQYVCAQRMRASDLNTSEVLATGEHVSVVREYLLRVQSVVWGRRLVLITVGDQKFLGLAPEVARKKDIVCIVYGCSVPLLLRNVDGARYQLLGECYVRGLMNGEALDLRDQVPIAERMFTLV